jgi:flagellar motility protein MotE (MotC chaperone)
MNKEATDETSKESTVEIDEKVANDERYKKELKDERYKKELKDERYKKGVTAVTGTIKA